MGWEHISILFDPMQSIEERVENNSSNGKSEAIVAIDNKGHKHTRMTYAQALKCQSNVAQQNKNI